MTRVVVTVLCLRRLFLGHALSGQVQVLSRDLSKRLESRELLRRCKGKIHFLAMLHLARSRRVRMSRLRHVVGEGQLVHLQQRALPVLERKRRTFLDEVIREAVYASFGELLAARLARVLVAVTCIFELRAALEVFENQLVRSAAHVQPQS